MKKTNSFVPAKDVLNVALGARYTNTMYGVG